MMTGLLARALAFALGFTLKTSAAGLAALIIARTLGRRRPGIALDLGLILFGAAAVFSLLPPMRQISSGQLSGVSIELPAEGAASAASQGSISLAELPAAQAKAGSRASPPGPSLPARLGLTWLLGCLAMIAFRLAAYVRIEVLVARAEEPGDTAFMNLVEAQARRLGLKAAPALRIGGAGESALGASPFVARYMKQVVIFPARALGWPEARVGFGLLHEFAHVKRHDNLRLGLIRAASILAWPSPLPWMALAECARLRERACDEEVLACGGEASSYAAELLAAVRFNAGPSKSKGFAAMAAKRGIEMRIRSILDREGAARAPSRLERSAAGFAMAMAMISFALVGAASAETAGPASAPAPGATGKASALDMVLPLAPGWRLTQSYGETTNPFDGKPYMHREIDLGADYGSPVRAAARGILVDSGFDKQMGYYAILEHGDSLRSRYTHLAGAVAAAAETELDGGAFLGKTGSSGQSTGPHLGFAVLVKGSDGGWRETDPLPFLARDSEGLVLEAVKAAVLANDLDELRSLLALKPNLNHRLADGSLPLESVLVMGNCEAARMLVDAGGADPKAKTKSGKTILDLARASENETLVSILSR